MLIRQTAGQVVLQCDGCGTVFYAETAEVSDAYLMAEADGWLMLLEGEERHHYCALCAREDA